MEKTLLKLCNKAKWIYGEIFFLRVYLHFYYHAFEGIKIVRCINIDKHKQANTQTQTHLVHFYCGTNSNSSNKNYKGFRVKLYCSFTSSSVALLSAGTSFQTSKSYALLKKQYFEVLCFAFLRKLNIFSCQLEWGCQAGAAVQALWLPCAAAACGQPLSLGLRLLSPHLAA